MPSGVSSSSVAPDREAESGLHLLTSKILEGDGADELHGRWIEADDLQLRVVEEVRL